MLVFLNDIARNIIPNNSAEILLVYYGYRVYPQVHGYTIVAFHPRVFQGYLSMGGTATTIFGQNGDRWYQGIYEIEVKEMETEIFI